MTNPLVLAALSLGAAGHLPATEAADATQRPLDSEHMQNGARAFDFMLGNWTIQNRRLRTRLAGANDWEEFVAHCNERRILNGLGIEEEYRTEHWPGFIGMAFRFYDPQSRQWSIYWADSHRGRLDPPLVGQFVGDTGVFEGRDELNGKPIRVRFIWSRIYSDSPRWEQAFSADDGRTWETNWTMDFVRSPVAYLSLPSYSSTGLADLSVLR